MAQSTSAAPNVVPIKPNRQIKPGAEYVTGSPFFTDQPRALPSREDSLRDGTITTEQIEQMLHDPDVYAGIFLIVLMALNEKLLITPAIKDDVADDGELLPTESKGTGSQPAADTSKPADSTPANQKDNVPVGSVDLKPAKKPVDPKVQLASDISDFCQRQVNRVPKFQSQMFQLCFDGLAHGNKVAEQVLEVPASGTDKDMWCLKAIKPKPREALAFVVDAYMNQIGFIGARPGMSSMVSYGTLVDPNDVIPREKFCVFTYRPRDNDPRGQTALDAAFNGWDLKRRGWSEYLLFMMVCAIPGILATLPPDADEMTVYEDDGTTPKRDAITGEVIKVSAHQFLLNMLGKMRNHQVAVAPDGTNFTPLEAHGEGEVFTKFFQTVKKEITHAILLQDLATQDSTHQTKGSTGQQFRIVDLLVFWVRDTLAEMVRYDIFKPLVRYNFGDEAADELLPNCSYGDTEARDWATDATAAAQIKDGLTDSQWDFVTTQLGIPLPTDAERVERKQAKIAAQQMQQQLANQPPGADNKPGKPAAGGAGDKPTTGNQKGQGGN